MQSVVLNKFQQADGLGRPVKLPDGSPKPMELVPPDPENPSNLLLSYDVNNKSDDKPLDTLGKLDWSGDADQKKEPEVKKETLADGHVRQSVTFVSPPVQGFQITKTYSLTEGDYHIGLEVKVKRLATATLDPDKPLPFRYQLSTAHGLPVEGRWYTNIFRNSLVGQTENNPSLYRGVVRDMQDLRQVAAWEGGNPVLKKDGYAIRYAGVAVQYFASAVVVDNDSRSKQDFLAQARPTLEKAVAKGVVKSISPTLDSFVLTGADGPTALSKLLHSARERKATFLESACGPARRRRLHHRQLPGIAEQRQGRLSGIRAQAARRDRDAAALGRRRDGARRHRADRAEARRARRRTSICSITAP